MAPIENAAMDDRTVIQWDKYDLDALGCEDRRARLGMLSRNSRALTEIGCLSRHCPLRLQYIPVRVPKVYDMPCHGDSVGVLQVEWPCADEHAAATDAALLLRPRDRDAIVRPASD